MADAGNSRAGFGLCACWPTWSCCFGERICRFSGEPVSPWNREFVLYLVVSAASVVRRILFHAGRFVGGQTVFSAADNDAYNCAERLAAALPMAVAPLLTVLFTSRSGARSGNIVGEQLKLLGLYVLALLFAAGALLLLRDLCVKIILGQPSPEA